jgi:general secretion pathway protein F
MPLYSYKALTTDDTVLEGQMEAATEKTVISKLQEMGYFPVSTEEVKNQTASHNGIFTKDVSSVEVLHFTQKLAVTMRAGLTLDAALALLIETADSERLKAVLEKVLAAVNNGISLSDALQQYSNSFDRFYINTLRAGESSGSLHQVLARLASHLERSRATKKIIQSALMYPAILVAVACVTLLILLVYVVPQFQSLFEDMGQALPLPTQIVIALADAIKDYGWIVVLALVGVIGVVRHMLRDSKQREPIDRLVLHLPLISEMVIRLEVARFSRSLSTLLSNGVTMLSALSIVAESLNNTVVRQALIAVKNNVKEGQSIASTLKKQQLFPPMAIQLIQVGEETGELVDMLEQVADIYDTELQDTVQRFLTLLEPLLIITLGVIIAGIIIAVLLAILALNDFAV